MDDEVLGYYDYGESLFSSCVNFYVCVKIKLPWTQSSITKFAFILFALVICNASGDPEHVALWIFAA